MEDLLLTQEPKSLPPSGSGRRSGASCSSSPEFEFWMLRNPSCPQPDLLSADELFVNGVLLPLDQIANKQPDPNPPPDPDTLSSAPSGPDPEPERCLDSERGPQVMSDPGTGSSASKRWRDIFKKDKGKNETAKKQEEREGEKGKERRKEKKSQSQTGTNPAELNINIWPFSRSRSAGNTGTRPKMAGSMGTRKVSSAPCSRSNSAGESKSRVKWPSSPGRTGVHLGRSSPVWQVRRGGSGLKTSDVLTRSGEKGQGGGKKEVTEPRRSKTVGNGGKTRVLNLNVPMCIGYRQNLSCRSDENGADNSGSSSGGDGHPTSVGGGGSLFNLRNLFAKKVY